MRKVLTTRTRLAQWITIFYTHSFTINIKWFIHDLIKRVENWEIHAFYLHLNVCRKTADFHDRFFIISYTYKQIILFEISLITKNITTWLVNKGPKTGNDGIYIIWSSWIFTIVEIFIGSSRGIIGASWRNVPKVEFYDMSPLGLLSELPANWWCSSIRLVHIWNSV